MRASTTIYHDRFAINVDGRDKPGHDACLAREFSACPSKLYLAYVVACIVLALVPGPERDAADRQRAAARHARGADLSRRHAARAGDRHRHRRCRADDDDGDHGLLVRLGASCRRRLPGLDRHRHAARRRAESPGRAAPPPRGGFFLQGMVVLLSNPKVLVFFGAFIPQFVDMKGDHFSQVALLGATFMVVAGDHRCDLCGAGRPGAQILLRAARRGCCRASPACS